MKKEITFLQYFKDNFETHYWREATYHGDAGYLDDRYLYEDIYIGTEHYEELYGIKPTYEDRKQAYDYIRNMTNKILDSKIDTSFKSEYKYKLKTNSHD